MVNHLHAQRRITRVFPVFSRNRDPIGCGNRAGLAPLARLVQIEADAND
jgi:hypothetical protein